MTIISVVMLTAFIVIYSITYTNIQKENLSKLESIPRLPQIALIADNYEPLTNNSDPKVLVRIPIDYSLSFAVLVNEEGQLIDALSYIDLPNEMYAKIAEKIWSMEKEDGTINFEDRKWQYRISSYKRVVQKTTEQQKIYGDGLYEIIFLDITDSSRTLTQLLITFVIVGTIMLGIIFIISLYFANRGIRPIEENWKKQKQFVADASHELKTPLAIISANADALLANGEETINSQMKWINYIKSETTRMGKLVKDMLYLANVEDTYNDQSTFNVSSIIIDVIASMEAVIFEKGLHLTQTVASDIYAKGDGEKLKQAVLILLDNAVKYTNDYGYIDIVLKRSRNHIIFSVENTGKEIPSEKLSRIFDRFYRCDPSRSHDTGAGGYGLGLSIAKAIIERSGGKIYVESTSDRTVFTFELKTS